MWSGEKTTGRMTTTSQRWWCFSPPLPSPGLSLDNGNWCIPTKRRALVFIRRNNGKCSTVLIIRTNHRYQITRPELYFHQVVVKSDDERCDLLQVWQLFIDLQYEKKKLVPRSIFAFLGNTYNCISFARFVIQWNYY